MTRDELQREVASHKWFHILDLGQGVITPGVTDPVGKEHGPRFHVPERLTGKSVLEIAEIDSTIAKPPGAVTALTRSRAAIGLRMW